LLLPLVCLIVAGPINRAWLSDQDPWDHYAYLSCSDGIAFGCLVALACARLRIPGHALRFSLVAGAVIASLIFLFTDEDATTGLAQYGLNDTILEIGVGMMLLALGSGVGNATLSRGTGWLRAIGRSSYEIYLFHMLVVLGLMTLFKRLQPAPTWIPCWYAAMILLSLLLGGLISRFYSEPLNSVLRSGGRLEMLHVQRRQTIGRRESEDLPVER
jgi:peptidoglycan/LPS O-acetylase OafA/YrhL